jgi:hypothetical protein
MLPHRKRRTRVCDLVDPGYASIKRGGSTVSCNCNSNRFRMFEGYYGPYYVPTVDADGNLTWTNNAGLPDPAPINIKGDPGTGLDISGQVDAVSDLPATAEDWSCYLVGTEVPYTVYTFNPNTGWMSLGELASGPKGDPGVTFTPAVSVAGVISWTNDGDLPNPEPVNIKGPAYTLTEEDKAEIVADVVDEIPLVDPDAKTAAMTQSVCVDANGKLWTAPGGQGGTTDYDQLSNRPSINGHTLTGNQSAAQLGLATPSDIPTVPTKTSDLTNDSGFVNASGAAAAAPVQSVNGKTGAVVLNAADVGAGTYSKPSGGIPASDLASAVQTSLGKADTALQSVPSTYRTAAAQDTIDSGKIDKPSNPTSGQFLVYNGTTWAATTVPSANGVNF